MDTPKERLGASVGSSIRAWRRRNRLTISRLAEKADIDSGFLAYIETGKKLPSLTTTHKLAAALGISLSELLLGASADPKPGFRTELRRLAEALGRGCTRGEYKELLAVFRRLDDPRKVRAIRVLLDG